MVKRLSIFLLFLSVPLAFGQLDSNSVTVTATRSTSQPPDVVVFSVVVQSGLNASLDDVVGVLKPAGITGVNFVGVSTPDGLIFTGSPALNPLTPLLRGMQWVFALPAPLAKIKDAVATLTTLQKNIAQQNNGLILSFAVQGTQVSPQSQQSSACPISDLLADARAQAQKLADAAGLSLGVVLAMSSATSIPAGGLVSAPAFVAGISFSTVSAPFPSICSMTVKFALLRY